VVKAGEVALGVVGELHPVVARRLGVEVRAFYFELSLGSVGQVGTTAVRRAVAPPRFPPSTRDLSFWIDVAVPAADVESALRSADEPLLRSVVPLEDFRDPRYVPAGKKGMLWSMTYRADDRTLTDADADAAHGRVVKALTEKYAIQIR
jgi:phenylalanyl-tRNA synthetase beta chain